MSDKDKAQGAGPERVKPVPRGGLLHVIDAAGYSLAGLRRLMQETAVRLELAGILLGALALALKGVGLLQWGIYFGLWTAVLVVEALNTALEELTDRISPEWSLAAKNAKDLGSAAVGMVICAAVAGSLALLCWDL